MSSGSTKAGQSEHINLVSGSDSEISEHDPQPKRSRTQRKQKGKLKVATKIQALELVSSKSLEKASALAQEQQASNETIRLLREDLARVTTELEKVIP